MFEEKKDKNEANLIFLHISKTGGTTLHQIIERQFKVNELYNIDSANIRKSIDEFKQLSDSNKAKLKCLKGHMNFGLHKYFIAPSEYITFLRNPVDRVISYYFHVVTRPVNQFHDLVVSNNISLERFIIDKITPDINNGYVRCITGIGDKKETLSLEDLEEAKGIIQKHFSFVGITEMFDESIFFMREKLKWDNNILYTKKNVNKRRPSKNQIPLEVIKLIKENNRLDIELFNFIKEKFKTNISSIDEKLKRRFEEYKIENMKYTKFYNQLDIKKNIDSNLVNYIYINSYRKNSEGLRVAIFGAGQGGKDTFRIIQEISMKYNLNIKVYGFIDNDVTKWGKNIFGQKIFKPKLDIFKEIDIVVVASMWRKEIIKQLIDMGVNDKKIVISL